MQLPPGDTGRRGAQRIHSRPPRTTIVKGLLGLFLICAPASAQEPLPQPPESAGNWVGAVRRTELPVGDGTVGGIIVDLAPDAGQPSDDVVPLRRITWAQLSLTDEGVASGLPAVPTQEPREQHPVPTHTGFKALVFETGSDFNAFPRRTSTWVILAIGGAAAAIAYPFDQRVTHYFVDSDAFGRFFVAGKWIGSAYVQAGTAVGLYVVGRYVMPHAQGEPKSNKVSHLGFDLLRALIVSQALTQAIKITVHRDRPTGECCAFPSGHSSAAFATASVLERHLGYRGAWPTFAIAAYVATSRLHDNRHFLSDVLFGGALGIASGWTVVGRHGRSKYALAPVPVPGGFMVSITRKQQRQLAP